jgi:hypothetical protein
MDVKVLARKAITGIEASARAVDRRTWRWRLPDFGWPSPA